MITPDDGGTDVYVHYSAVEVAAGSSLVEGERVEFSTERGRNGLEARQVRSLELLTR